MTLNQRREIEHPTEALLLENIAPLLEQYQGFIVDIWGVIHNGVAIFPDVISTFQHLKSLGKKIILLSNAPRRIPIAKARLAEMGLDPALYDDIYTSGEDCHRALLSRPDAWYQALGQRLYHLGPERDRTVFQGLSYEEATSIETADFLLITGTIEAGDTADKYQPLLEKALFRNLPALCANADRHVVLGEKKIHAAGAIAELYEKLGGNVRYHGKPNPEIYAPVCAMMNMPTEQLLAIGDALGTDIRGAQNVGIDTLLILNGVHRSYFQDEVNPATLHQLCQEQGITPTYALSMLR